MSNDRYDLVHASEYIDLSSVRLLYVTTAKYGGDWHSVPHTHSCAELFYVVGGRGQFRIENRLYTVGEDDLVIVNPNVQHTEMGLNSNPLEYIVLGIEGVELSVRDESDSRFRIVNFHGGDDVLHCLKSILWEMEVQKDGCEKICSNLLEILMIRLMRRTKAYAVLVPADVKGNRQCAAVRRYIDEHFKEPLTLDIIADENHINKYHMTHCFSREYGISPISYMISRRIDESRYLLSRTDMSMAQISEVLGFSSPSYFSQSFKKYEGMQPAEYRKKKRGVKQSK